MSATQATGDFSSCDAAILGAGYAGLMAALRLRQRRRGLRITLVSIRDQFLEGVRLQETIVAEVAPRITSISAFVAGTNIEFICGSVASLDADQRRIDTDGGERIHSVFAVANPDKLDALARVDLKAKA